MEERIKELAQELWQHPKVVFQTEDYEIVLETLAQYFRTVVAEARKEGIDEMRDAALFAIDHYDGEPLAEVAERLKEKP